MKLQMLLLIGLPGSGKTSWAEKYISEQQPPHKHPWRRVSWDDLRKEDPAHTPSKFNREREDAMKQRGYNLVRRWVSEGFSIIIDNTNLTESARYKWAQLAIELNLDFSTYRMPSAIDACIERDRRRSGDARVGRAVIERTALFNDLIKFPVYEEYVIVDMDGTLSDSSKRQKYLNPGVPCPKCGKDLFLCSGKKKDWNSFFSHVNEDDTNPFVEELVRSLAQRMDRSVIIVSGRPIDKCGKAAEDWLNDHQIPYKHLFMRQGGDKRPDTIVKKEILDKLPKNQIFCCIDDRLSIIRMWRENGLNVIDVGKGVEF